MRENNRGNEPQVPTIDHPVIMRFIQRLEYTGPRPPSDTYLKKLKRRTTDELIRMLTLRNDWETNLDEIWEEDKDGREEFKNWKLNPSA